MKSQTKILLFGLMYLLLISSCCFEKENHYSLPEETLRYYQAQDTIRFFSPETSQYEIYIVCVRNDDGILNRPRDNGSFCYYEDLFDYRDYWLRRDSCNSNRFFNIYTISERNDDIRIQILSKYNGSEYDKIETSYNNENKSDVEIMSFTYENTINLNPDPQDGLTNVIYSLEYGIVQYQFDSLIFSLINHEK